MSSLKLEIEETPALSKGQQKKADMRAAAEKQPKAEEDAVKQPKAAPTSMDEQIKALIDAIKIKIEEISILIAEKQSIDDAFKRQLEELLNHRQGNQQELTSLQAQLSKFKKVLTEETDNDSVGGADIVQPPTAKSAKQEPSPATKAPTLAQKAAAAASLVAPAPTKAPSVAPALKGKEAASAASSKVALVEVEPFMIKNGKGCAIENPIVTTMHAMDKLLDMRGDPMCPATFAQAVLALLIDSFKEMDNYPVRKMPCERKGCEHAKKFGNHTDLIAKIEKVFFENPTETLKVFEMVVQNLSIAGVNGMFEGKKFSREEKMTDFVFDLSDQYSQAIQ